MRVAVHEPAERAQLQVAHARQPVEQRDRVGRQRALVPVRPQRGGAHVRAQLRGAGGRGLAQRAAQQREGVAVAVAAAAAAAARVGEAQAEGRVEVRGGGAGERAAGEGERAEGGCGGGVLRGEVGFGRGVAEGRRVEVREDEVDDLGAEVAEAGHGEGGELGVWRSLWDDVMELCARTMGSDNDVQSRLKWCLCWCSSRRW